VLDEESERWFFSVYSQGDADQGEPRFGLTDEASKLNINEATEEMFEKLPTITPYLARACSIFWTAMTRRGRKALSRSTTTPYQHLTK